MSQAMIERNRLFNSGYDDAWQDTGCNLDLYETTVPYKRGYDAGERDREEDVAGDYDPPTPDEMKGVYGDESR